MVAPTSGLLIVAKLTQTAIHRQLFQRILDHTVQEMSDQRKDAAAAWERLLSNGSVSLPPDVLEAVRRQHVVQRTPLDSQNLQNWSPFLQRQPMIQQGGWGGTPCILLSSQAMEWDYFVSYGRNVFEHVCHMYMIVQFVISQQSLLLGKVRLVI